ncbi:MAG: GHKL domain-containing protein [Lachnospiraceae bacterium]|jgi:two-component system sensor histidine kinase AgrC|nr:GHKL domain-containing protein [Lachnospiraceae bacterium]
MFEGIHRRIAERKLGSRHALMETHYEEVQAMYQQMRTWRHDFKNHLQVMKAQLDMGEYQELSEYILKLDEELARVSKVIETGNLALDAILNSKIAMVRARGIDVNVKVVLPAKLSVADYDLCVLLGNLLDNAIEGCESQKEGEDRFLRIYIGVLKEQLYLSVANSHDIKMKKEGSRYRSTKAPDRGLGMLSIDSIAARYHGYVNRQSDESAFVTEVLLPLKG